MKHVSLYLDEDDWRELKVRAARGGTTMAALIYKAMKVAGLLPGGPEVPPEPPSKGGLMFGKEKSR